jgi:hypothetical protein
MKKVIAIATLSALTSAAYAQLNPLPPSSTTEGVSVTPLAGSPNAGITHWEDTADLAAYKFASDGTENVPNMDSPDNKLGLSWSSAPNGNIALALNSITAKGGAIQAIFTGESAGWYNDFGYTYSGTPQGPNSYTVFSDIQAVGGAGILFGDSIFLNFSPGEAANFDFWLNGVGAMGNPNPVPPTANGGVYTVFNPLNSNPYNPPGNVKWAQSPIFVNTWVQALNGGAGGYADVATWLVGVEDWNLATGSDGDSNDFMFALQFFREDGTPFTPVPEPATYGLIGAAALLGLVARRRFAKKQS